MLFDRANGKFSLLAAKGGFSFNAAAALISCGGCANDHKVLITGGWDGYDVFPYAELYDPVSHTFIEIANMNEARAFHTATALNDGTILIAGGSGDATAEIYDLVAETFTLTSALYHGTGSDMVITLSSHTATLLGDGTVLIAGGVNCDAATQLGEPGCHSVSSASIYDPKTGIFTPTSNAMQSARQNHTATLISGTTLAGQVLLSGGDNYSSEADVPLSTADLYNPATRSFTATLSDMSTARTQHAAAQIP